MQINTYLNFNGQCEEAFKYYEKFLGAEIGLMFRYKGTPLSGQVPEQWQEKIMHGSLTVAGLRLMGADMAVEGYEPPQGFSLSIHIESIPEAERIFQALSYNGKVTMPLEKTFWADRFGMLVDQFGIPWIINCGGNQ